MVWPAAVERLGTKECGALPDGPAESWSSGLPELAAPLDVPVAGGERSIGQAENTKESEGSIGSAECTNAPLPRLGGGRASELKQRLAVRLNSYRRALQDSQL